MTNRNKTKLPFPEVVDGKNEDNKMEGISTLGSILYDYFGPPQSGKKSFWRTPLAKPLAAAQRGANALAGAGRINVNLPRPKTGSKLANKLAGLPVSLGEGLAETAANVPRNIGVGSARLGKDIGEAISGQNELTGMELATGAAPLAETGLDIVTASLGPKLLSSVGGSLSSDLLKGSLFGGSSGGAISFLRELENQRDQDKPDWNKLAMKTTEGSLAGALLGAAFSGTAYGFKMAKSKLANIFLDKESNLTKKEASSLAERMLRDAEGKFTGINPEYAKQKLGKRNVPVTQGGKTTMIELQNKIDDTTKFIGEVSEELTRDIKINQPE